MFHTVRLLFHCNALQMVKVDTLKEAAEMITEPFSVIFEHSWKTGVEEILLSSPKKGKKEDW